MMLATSMTASFTCVTFILCSFCYGTILKFLLNNKHNSSMAIKTEYRLYIQILGLFVAFALIFVYFVVMFFLSIRSDRHVAVCHAPIAIVAHRYGNGNGYGSGNGYGYGKKFGILFTAKENK
ncbi:hypothetical protein DICVIV_06685 [Dictyocaulus viviparus]|uniref:Uncharacterized protein n=1 Tax=Dictyocaulus viviparus TaxID=29172 RepID=A0A0D8XY09_DICVI|nr:hypothetical protein DICVIV_06685 [Dictyocaulus viviparus]